MGDGPNFALRQKKAKEPEVEVEVEEVSTEPAPTQLPTPTGYKLLVTLPEVKETFDDSKVVKAESTMRLEEIGAVCMFVLALGPDAYKDKERFSKPYCKAGDFVMLRSYSGTRFKVFGKEFRLVNDGQVEAVVSDPRGIVKL